MPTMKDYYDAKSDQWFVSLLVGTVSILIILMALGILGIGLIVLVLWMAFAGSKVIQYELLYQYGDYGIIKLTIIKIFRLIKKSIVNFVRVFTGAKAEEIKKTIEEQDRK